MKDHLQKYNKWDKLKNQPKIGDVVAVLDETTKMKKQLSEPHKAMSWRKRFNIGRIIELIPGRDGICRRVILKYRNHRMERSVHNIYLIYSDTADLTHDEIASGKANYAFPTAKEIKLSRQSKGLNSSKRAKTNSKSPTSNDENRRSARLAAQLGRKFICFGLAEC
jgi:hypothetical protein